MHLPLLIGDLALILMVAGLFSVLFRRLNQPSVLGYLLAGVLVGPNISMLPTVLDIENIKVWAELGIIIFLFLLGMEFSFKKLIDVGRPAVIAALIHVFGMLVLGYFVGQMFGWTSTQSIFLGALLSISSTAIVVKAFEELSVKTQLFASMSIGVLLVQDLLVILMLAFLSTMAVSRTFEGEKLLYQIGKLVAFLIIVIPVGLKILPKILHRLRPYLNDESRVVLALGLCLSMVLLASKSGLSAALGAFIMGALMAETPESERFERFLRPIKDLFGAIFFTSVGMLVNFGDIGEHWRLVIALTLVTVLGKISMTALGLFAARQNRAISLQTAFSLAQIGEFSFIIATLGLELKVVQPELYSVIVAVAIITTFFTPYLIRLGMSSRILSLKKGEKDVGKKAIPKLWDGHLVELEAHPHFANLGRTLEELHLRETFGVSIVAIIRGEMRITAPTRYERLMAYDRVVVMGTDEQLRAFEKYMQSERHSLEDVEGISYELKQIEVLEHSSLVGKNLRTSGIRELVDGIIFGIERDSEKYLNPDSTFIIQAKDVLWIYGEKRKIRNFASESKKPDAADFHH